MFKNEKCLGTYQKKYSLGKKDNMLIQSINTDRAIKDQTLEELRCEDYACIKLGKYNNPNALLKKEPMVNVEKLKEMEEKEYDSSFIHNPSNTKLTIPGEKK